MAVAAIHESLYRHRHPGVVQSEADLRPLLSDSDVDREGVEPHCGLVCVQTRRADLEVILSRWNAGSELAQCDDRHGQKIWERAERAPSLTSDEDAGVGDGRGHGRSSVVSGARPLSTSSSSASA
jgi:hypothetical protein